MAKLGVLCLIIVALWVYNYKPSEALLVLQIGDKCDSNISSNYHSSNGSGNFGFSSNMSGGLPGVLCDSTIPLECILGRCQCKRGFTISRNGTKCLEVARNGLESTCEESIQCWKSLLGRLSECNTSNGKCQCYESETLPIVFHQGRCYYGEGLGDFCQIEGLCTATTPNAMCRTGTCQCTEGYVPSWDKSRCLQIATQGLNSSCEENVQCEKSQLGTLSECNQETMQCQCYRIPMVPTVFHQGRCYFGAALGDVCQVVPQCLAKTVNSLCGRDGKCHCDDGHVPNGNLTVCLPIASSDGTTESECIEDVQCTRALGHFARCNLAKEKCECFVPENSIRNFSRGTSDVGAGAFTFDNETAFIDPDSTSMVIVGSKCYSAKNLGQSCKYNRQCSAITENSVCYNGQCECQEESHVPSHDGRKCLEIAKTGLDSPCDEDRQCQSSILGPLSRCSAERKRCECSNVLPVVFHENKCFFHRQLGASCESHSECKAGSNIYSECIRGRCQCMLGTHRANDHSCVLSVSSSSASTFGTFVSSNLIQTCFLLLPFLHCILHCIIIFCHTNPKTMK